MNRAAQHVFVIFFSLDIFPLTPQRSQNIVYTRAASSAGDRHRKKDRAN
jgi:hypothetical protein